MPSLAWGFPSKLNRSLFCRTGPRPPPGPEGRAATSQAAAGPQRQGATWDSLPPGKFPTASPFQGLFFALWVEGVRVRGQLGR